METPGDVPARGLVEARVPYDGQHFFDEAALGDVRAAVEARALLQDEEPETTVEAHIGHITISDYGRSRLAGERLAGAARVSGAGTCARARRRGTQRRRPAPGPAGRARALYL
jgi:hypothetical protein